MRGGGLGLRAGKRTCLLALWSPGGFNPLGRAWFTCPAQRARPAGTPPCAAQPPQHPLFQALLPCTDRKGVWLLSSAGTGGEGQGWERRQVRSRSG